MTEEALNEELVGRADELATMRVAMQKGPCLLHVTGPAGSGKSALALEAARRFGPGTRLLRLGSASDQAGVSAVLAERGWAGSLEAWIAEIRSGAIVLDAIDDVADLVRRALDSLLAAGLNVPILLTSSERLGLPGEQTVVAGPLSATASRELFARSVRRAREGASLSEDEEAVGRVVACLGGLPLALVSAAERMSILDAGELAKRLEAGGRPVLAGTELESSLRRALDRLSPELCSAVRQCSVFEGAFSVEDAEAVVKLESGRAVVEALHDLRKRWMLSSDPRDEHAMRLAMGKVLRAFVRDEAETLGAVHEARTRHAQHFAARARRQWRDEGPLVARFELEDFLGAARTLCDEGDLDGALSLIACIEPTEPTLLTTPSGRELLDTLVAKSGTKGDRSLEGRALLARGRILQYVGRTDLAVIDVEGALEHARKGKDPLLEGLVLQRLGSLRTDSGEAPLAVTLLGRSVGLLEPRSWRGTVSALNTLGTAEMACGDNTAARESFLRALTLRERHGDSDGTGQEHAGIGATLFQEGRLDEAVRSFDRARDLLAKAGSRDTFGYTLAARAMAVQELGRFADAESDLGRALEAFRVAKNRRFWRVFSGYLAQAQHEAGAHDRAETTYRDAIRALRTDGHVAYEGLFTASLAALLATCGRCEEAESLIQDAGLRSGDSGGRKDPRSLAMEIHGGHLALAKAKIAKEKGEDPSPHLERAKARLALAVDARTDDDVRFAERLLARAISALDGGASPTESLYVGKDVSSFRVGPRAPVDLRRKRATRSMMRALVDERLRAPGAPMSVEALVKATWPGERILPHAALSRAYVTVLMLRNLGLRSLLLQRDGGYLLDPEVPLLDDE